MHVAYRPCQECDRGKWPALMKTILGYFTPCGPVLPETPTQPQLAKTFPSFYGTLRLITTFKIHRHLSLSLARHFTSSHAI